MRTEHQKKFIERLNHHTTSEADRVIQEVPQAVQKIVTAELDKRFGPAPQGAKEEALVQRAAANKILRELRKRERKDAASPAGAAAEPADTTQLPDSVLELGKTEERPAKRRADAFAPLRAVLAKYQVDGYDVWHVPADDRPRELRFLDNLDHDMLVASLAGIPVRHGKDEIVMGTPQFIGGDHVAHGGH